jgi:hypothetical protein
MKNLKILILLIFCFISLINIYGQIVNDVKINEDTNNAFIKYQSKLSINKSGNSIIVWIEERTNLHSANVICQRFNNVFKRIGNNIIVNIELPDTSIACDAAIRKDNSFGVLWQKINSITPNRSKILFRLFDSNGFPLTNGIIVNDTIIDFFGYPAIASDGSNGFIVVFVYPKSVGGTDVFYQKLDSLGNKIGHNVNVSLIGSVYISPIESGPKIAVRKDGSFIITWQDIRPPSVPTGDIYMQMFDKNGVPVGVNTKVNDPDFEPEDLQCAPQIAVDSSGGFTIAFDDVPYSTNVYRVKYQRFDKNGVKLGSNKLLYNGIHCVLKQMSSDEQGNLDFLLEYVSGMDLCNLRVNKNDSTIGNFFAVSNYSSSAKVGYDLKLYDGKIYSTWGDKRNGGWDIYANVRSFINPDSTVGIVQIGTEVPVEYSLSQNYPNPFNPVTKINFAIPKAGMVTIKLYDILGREVSRLVNEFKAAGEYTIDFNADRLSSGVYFYRMETSGFSDIKKMMLLK